VDIQNTATGAVMAKTLYYERTLDVAGEHIALKLFKVSRGYSLERRMVEVDDAASVQILLISSLEYLIRFEGADPYRSQMMTFYNEIRRPLSVGVLRIEPLY
jgi:hypothetical protein